MKILSLYVENFGKLHQFEEHFEDKFNTIKQDNGWGKTTLAMFVKSMFYGLSGDRKALPENERKKFKPWQGGNFGGSIVFSVAGKTYKLSRIFGETASKDDFTLIDTKTNKPSQDYSQNIGQELFGLDEKGFARSVFIATENLQSKENASIKQRLTELLEDVGDTTSMDEALKQLDKKRQLLKNNQKNGQIPELQQQLFDLKQNIEQLQAKETIAKQNKLHIAELEAQINKLDVVLQTQTQQLEQIQQQSKLQYVHNTLREKQEKLLLLKQELQENEKQFKQMPTKVAVDTLAKVEQAYKTKQELIASAKETIEKEQNSELVQQFEHTTITQDKINKFSAMALGGGATQNYLVQESGVNKLLFMVLGLVMLVLLGVGTTLTILQQLWAISLLVIGFLGVVILIGVYTKQSLSTTLVSQSVKPNKKNQKNKGLRDFLLTFYKENEINNEVVAMQNLQNSWQLYVSKKEVISSYAKQMETYQTDLVYQKEKLDNFVQTYLVKVPENMQVLEFVQRLLLKQDDLLLSVEKMKQEIAEFEREHKTELATRPNSKLSLGEAEKLVRETRESVAKRKEEKVALITTTTTLLEQVDQIYELQNQVQETTEKLQELELQFNIVLKTMKYLKQARDNVAGRYLQPMERTFSHYAEQLKLNTLGKLTFDTDLAMKIEENGTSHEVEYFSRGYQDLLQFTMRLALVSVLFEKEKPFLVLDDPFTHFDENKVNFVSGVLKTVSQQYQVIYFTCHESRELK